MREEAEKWWRRAADEPLKAPSQPEEPWSEHYYFKAVALDRLGRKDEARALSERLAALSNDRRMFESEPLPPQGALRFVLAGLGLKAVGQREAAQAAFRQALQLDAKNERAQAELDNLRREAN